MQANASVPASGDSKAAIGEALKQALAGTRLQSLSLHDERGDVLWLDEGALGPDEHNLVVDATSVLSDAPDTRKTRSGASSERFLPYQDMKPETRSQTIHARESQQIE
jgi:hypothetical protein